MGATEEPRGSRDNPLCAWHDDDIRAIKDDAQALDKDVRLLAQRIPDGFAATFAVLVADVTNIKKALETQFVTRAEFDPYKRTMDKIFGLLIAAVVVGVLGLIWKVGQ
jgi:hypothetical protein